MTAVKNPGVTPRHSGKVLIVDDEQETLDFIRECLPSDKYVFLCARSGEEALDLIKKTAPDVVLTDLRMPGMGGIELIRRIRQDGVGKLLTIIVITGADDPSSSSEVDKAGANIILPKPFNVINLQLAVRSALELKQLIDGL